MKRKLVIGRFIKYTNTQDTEVYTGIIGSDVIDSSCYLSDKVEVLRVKEDGKLEIRNGAGVNDLVYVDNITHISYDAMETWQEYKGD